MCIGEFSPWKISYIKGGEGFTLNDQTAVGRSSSTVNRQQVSYLALAGCCSIQSSRPPKVFIHSLSNCSRKGNPIQRNTISSRVCELSNQPRHSFEFPIFLTRSSVLFVVVVRRPLEPHKFGHRRRRHQPLKKNLKVVVVVVVGCFFWRREKFEKKGKKQCPINLSKGMPSLNIFLLLLGNTVRGGTETSYSNVGHGIYLSSRCIDKPGRVVVVENPATLH